VGELAGNACFDAVVDEAEDEEGEDEEEAVVGEAAVESLLDGFFDVKRHGRLFGCWIYIRWAGSG